jgi:hypothetical protein
LSRDISSVVSFGRFFCALPCLAFTIGPAPRFQRVQLVPAGLRRREVHDEPVSVVPEPESAVRDLVDAAGIDSWDHLQVAVGEHSVSPVRDREQQAGRRKAGRRSPRVAARGDPRDIAPAVSRQSSDACPAVVDEPVLAQQEIDQLA